MVSQNTNSCLRLISVVLTEISEEWLTGRTFITFEGTTYQHGTETRDPIYSKNLVPSLEHDLKAVSELRGEAGCVIGKMAYRRIRQLALCDDRKNS